jgi:hypothetical protein
MALRARFKKNPAAFVILESGSICHPGIRQHLSSWNPAAFVILSEAKDLTLVNPAIDQDEILRPAASRMTSHSAMDSMTV